MKLRGLWLFLLAAFFVPHVAFGQATSTAQPPSCTIGANPSTIESGQRTKLTWVSSNASRGTLPPVGNISAKGSVYVTPSKTTDYLATFTGPGGTTSCTTRVTVRGFGTGGETAAPIVPNQAVEPERTDAVNEVTPDTIAPQVVNTGGFPSASGLSVPQSRTVSGGGLFGGLVPEECRGSNAIWACDFCAFGQMLQNIINWLLAISILVAAAMFAWAGILFFTSAANIKQRQQAKSIFSHVVLGFFFAIGGWLFVQTTLGALVRQDFFLTSGKWNTLDCRASRTARSNMVYQNVNDWLRTSLPGVTQVNQAPAVSVGQSSVYSASSCRDGYQFSDEYAQCFNATTGDVYYPAATGSSNFGAAGSIANAMAAYKDEVTSAGPDGGNLACAWAVNNVLSLAGISAIDGNSVYNMEQELIAGRGTAVTDLSQAEPGNIIVWKGIGANGREVSHVGFCANAGCTETISNSSGAAKFNATLGQTFNGVQGRVYSVK